MAVAAGLSARSERKRRGWSLDDVGRRAGISGAHVQSLEAGEPVSLESYARVLVALGLRPALIAEGASSTGRPPQDVVHSAMGELGVRRLRSHGFAAAIDEPYQHDQFAGRADVVAWDLDRKALLHIENRTQFPNVQEALGSYGAKRAYLPTVLAERLGLRGAWASVTHVMVALWSAEVLHGLRLRRETFRSACPDAIDSFVGWWAGTPSLRGTTSSFVLLDPAVVREPHRFASFDAAMTAKPRYRDYADAAKALRNASERRAGAT
jgi:hypothetical protein